MKVFHASWLGAAIFGGFAGLAGAAGAPAPPGPSAVPSAPPLAQPAAPQDPARDLEPAVNTSAPTPAKVPADAASSAAQVPASSRKPVAADTSSAKAPATPGSAVQQGKSLGTAPTVPPAAQPGARAARVMDRLNLDATQVTGNSELPKVLYIVPWKRADLGDLAGRPMNSLLDEVLTPIDRDVFRRENRYYDALEAGATPAGREGTRDER